MKVNQHGAASCTACCHLQAAAAARADEHWESEQISARKIQPQAGRQAGQNKQLSRVRPAAAASLAADDGRPCHSGQRKTPKWRIFSRGKQQERKQNSRQPERQKNGSWRWNIFTGFSLAFLFGSLTANLHLVAV